LKILAIALLLILAFPAATFANNQVSVTIDGERVAFSGQGPAIVDGRTLVPVRGVFEALGFGVDWNEATRTATLTSDGHVVTLTIGSANFTTNGASYELDVPAQIIGGSTMLPIRAVLESVGLHVGWNEASRTVIISSIHIEAAGTARETISAGFNSNYVIRPDGSLWAWGYDILGDGTENIHDEENLLINARLSPVLIMDDVIHVSSGATHATAIRSDGSLWTWGSNANGQLGNGAGGEWDSNSLTPIRILSDVVAVSAGGHHNMAIRSDGSLWAWGRNELGQVGDGTTENRMTPVRIMDNVRAVSAGQEHTMAIRDDGSLWAWGSSRFGNLGNGSSSDGQMASASNPNPIRIMDNVTAVSTSGDHTMAIRGDGSLWAWGINWNGELGIGVFAAPGGHYGTPMNPDSYRSSPVRVLDNVVAVSAGRGLTMAVRSDGSLWGWGQNRTEALGIATANHVQATPIRIIDDVLSVSVGFQTTLVIRSDGSLWAWGSIAGDGTNEVRPRPVRIMDSVMLPN